MSELITEAEKAKRKAKLTPAEQVLELQKQLQDAKQKEKEHQKDRAAVVGFAVLEEMETNPQFSEIIVQILKENVTTAKDKALIADVLIEAQQPAQVGQSA